MLHETRLVGKCCRLAGRSMGVAGVLELPVVLLKTWAVHGMLELPAVLRSTWAVYGVVCL